MTWEYKTVLTDTTGFFAGGKLDAEEFDAKLNALGRKGWELVSVMDTNAAQGVTRHVVAVFKRAVSRDGSG